MLVGSAAVMTVGARPSRAGTPEAGVAMLLAQTSAPGAGMAVLRGGQVTQAVGGLRALGQSTPVADADRWHIGSNTKAMTAMLVARLAEAGVVRWDDTVGGILGLVVTTIDPAYQDATYADLLHHRAGLTANIGLWSTLQMVGSLALRDMRQDRLDYAQEVLASAPEVAPGAFLYSNAGYVVAGLMLQVTTGQIWEDLIRDHVFAPLGIKSAGFGAPGTANILGQPRGHKLGLLGGLSAMEPGPKADNIPALGPAGRVHIDLADMMRFLAAQAARDTAFLSRESWLLLHGPAGGGDYAMGWRVSERGHLAHNGSNTMWFARMQIDPATGNAVFLVVNRGDADHIRDVMMGLADAALAG
jgi:D-alanyl-D-alanine carboxypeptidase